MPVSIRRTFSLVSILILATSASAAGQGFTLATPDSSARITFGGRVQTIFNTTSADDEPATQTELRRVRLEANLQLGRVVQGRIQPEFAGSRVTLKDAYVRLNLAPALQLWAGQAHRPFGVVSPGSTTRILPIEKGLRIRGVSDAWDEYNLLLNLGYSDRDVGLQLRGEPHGAPLGLSYAVGFFNGPARALAPDQNSWQGVARLVARPAPGVAVGASWSRIDFVRTDDDIVYDPRAGTAWEADVEIGSDRGGPHLVAEATTGDFDPFEDATFWGAQTWLGYRFGRVSSAIAAVEPLLRVSHGDIDRSDAGFPTDDTGGTLITPGVNFWLGGLNRFAINVDVWSPEEGERVHALKALFQMAF
jgi:hypothetical protein